VPPFRAAQIVGARLAFFVSLAHVKDRLKQGDGVFESGPGNRRQIAQILGKHLVSIRLQIRGFSATEKSLKLTKQIKIDQCERVRVNWKTSTLLVLVRKQLQRSRKPLPSGFPENIVFLAKITPYKPT